MINYLVIKKKNTLLEIHNIPPISSQCKLWVEYNKSTKTNI